MKLSSVSVMTSIITLVCSLILGRIMSPEHFGTYSFYQSILMIMLNITSFGSSLSLSIYMFRVNPKKANKIVVNCILFIVPIISLVYLTIYGVFSTYIGSLDYTFIFVVASCSLMSICLLAIDYLRCKQDIKRFSLLIVGYTVASSVFAVIGYIIWKDVWAVYFSILIGAILPTVMAIFEFAKAYNLKLGGYSKLLVFKWSLKYGLPVVLQTTIMSFLVLGDRILLGSLAKPSVLANYSVAALIASTALFFVNNFASAWGGYLFKYLSSVSNDEMVNSYKKNKKKVLLAIPIGLIVFVFQYILYLLFFSEKYPGLFLPILILTLGYSFYGISKFFMNYLNFFGKNYFIFYASFICSFVMVFLTLFVFEADVLTMSLLVFFSFSTHSLFMYIITERLMQSKVVKENISYV
jgi:O-antigen/teichoic acid export membrane protein